MNDTDRQPTAAKSTVILTIIPTGWTEPLSVGDKLRVLQDSLAFAPVRSGEVVTVTRLYANSKIDVTTEDGWTFSLHADLTGDALARVR